MGTSDLDRVADMLRAARRVFVITGAGISAESGLPTYRGVGGLYDVECPEQGLTIEEILSGGTFRRRPDLTWKYLAQMEAACRGATFNRAHAVVREMEDHLDAVCVLTQNVDGFHRAAGSTDVIDIHGDLHELVCTRCARRKRVADYSGLTIPPGCASCDGLLRPDVVLFGELLPMDRVARLERQLHSGFDLLFTIGTTSLFPYIAAPVLRAHEAGVPTVEINPGRTEVSGAVDVKLALPAVRALDAIWERYLARPAP